MAAASRRLAHAIREAIAPEGLGVFQLNGAAAGQTVFHYHMHLVPRWQGQEFKLHSRVRGDARRAARHRRADPGRGEALGAKRAASRGELDSGP